MRFRTKRRGTVSIDTAEEFCAEDREKTPEIFYKSLGGLTYIRFPVKSWGSGYVVQPLPLSPPASLELIQVELLRRRLRLTQIQGGLLAI